MRTLFQRFIFGNIATTIAFSSGLLIAVESVYAEYIVQSPAEGVNAATETVESPTLDDRNAKSDNTTTETAASPTLDDHNTENASATDSSSVTPVGNAVDTPLTTPPRD